MEDFRKLKKANYGEKVRAFVKGGVIDFDPDSLKEVVGAKSMTYDEYLDTQIRSLGQSRSYFEMCYYNFSIGFKGQIEKIATEYVCFKRIFASGMFPDGDMFDGKEDHVWMEQSGFEPFKVGDCVEFSAEVYRYVKTGNGKLIDYSLRNPADIKKIAVYELPSDDDLIRQEVEQLICETCFLGEQCDRELCTHNPKERKNLEKKLFEAIKSNNKPQ